MSDVACFWDVDVFCVFLCLVFGASYELAFEEVTTR